MQGTWFDVGLGACGDTDTNSAKIVAISSKIYGTGGNCNQVRSLRSPAKAADCADLFPPSRSQWMQITNTANGKTAYGKVRDECPGCGQYDIGAYKLLARALRRLSAVPVYTLLIRARTCTDMSPSLFQELGSLSTGVLKVSWHYENKAFVP